MNISIKEIAHTYHNFNQATTIVFLHDSLGCTALWRDFPERLARAAGMNAFSYDRLGYGQSPPFASDERSKDYMEKEVEILTSVLEEHGIENPVLFGHSDGGTIALLAAAKYPNAFQAVITEGAHVFVEEETIDGILRAKEQYATTNLKERLQKYHGANTQPLFDAWTETWLSPMYRDWNIEVKLAGITCPVMVIQGSEDEYGTLAQVDAILGGVSAVSKKCIVANAGHSPHKQSERWLINECCLFLEDVTNPKEL